MYSEIIEKFLDFNNDVKDEAWAAEMVRLVILNARPVINKFDYEQRKKVLFGEFPEANMKRIFTGKTMARLKDKLSSSTVVFFERVRNALIDERNNAGLTITVNSLDPEKEMKRKSDKELLQNRKAIESLLNEFTSNNGMPPKQFTEDDYHGNMGEFDQKGYDEFDESHVNDFFENCWGLKAEIELSKCINPIIRTNQLSRNFDKYVNDILICLHNFSQVTVDQMEGKLKVDHLYPWEVEVVHVSDSNDFKDADGFLLRKQTNIRGFLRKFGTTFNFEKDWNLLLTAAYGGNSDYRYSGITENGFLVCGEPSGKTIDLRTMMDLPISYGYAEFKTINNNTTKLAVTKEGNLVKTKINGSEEYKPVDGAESDDIYKEDTYYAYYFESMAGTQPKLVKWGKLYMQEFEGQNDEYSGFSIKGNRRDGVPVAVILEPFHNLIQVSFKMTEMLINDVKPDGLIINYSSILKVAEYLKENAKDAPADQMNGIEMFMKMVEESPHLLADTPEGDEGEVLGGGNLGVQTKKNGLNEAANDLIKIIDWVEAKVEKYLGTQGVDLTDEKAGYKLSIENKKRARSATAFIDSILLNHLEDISITLLNQIQDISHFKNIPAYKYLESLIGPQALDFIASLEKSVHRYGIFMDTFNNDIELLEIRGQAEDARKNKEITLLQYMMVRSFESPKQAMAYMAREMKKVEDKKQQDQMNLLQQQDAINEKQFQRQLKLEDRKGMWMERARGQEAKGFYTAAQINANAQIATKQIQEDGQNKRLAATAVNDIDKIAKTADMDAQKSAI